MVIPNLVLKYLIPEGPYYLGVFKTTKGPGAATRSTFIMSVCPSVRPSVTPAVSGSAERTSNKKLSSVPRTPLYVFNFHFFSLRRFCKTKPLLLDCS